VRKNQAAVRAEMTQLHMTIQELRNRLEKQHGQG
jgi:hypothetical protein